MTLAFTETTALGNRGILAYIQNSDRYRVDRCSNGNLVFLSGNSTLHVSTDDGQTWAQDTGFTFGSSTVQLPWFLDADDNIWVTYKIASTFNPDTIVVHRHVPNVNRTAWTRSGTEQIQYQPYNNYTAQSWSIVVHRNPDGGGWIVHLGGNFLSDSGFRATRYGRYLWPASGAPSQQANILTSSGNPGPGNWSPNSMEFEHGADPKLVRDGVTYPNIFMVTARPDGTGTRMHVIPRVTADTGWSSTVRTVTVGAFNARFHIAQVAGDSVHAHMVGETDAGLKCRTYRFPLDHDYTVSAPAIVDTVSWTVNTWTTSETDKSVVFVDQAENIHIAWLDEATPTRMSHATYVRGTGWSGIVQVGSGADNLNSIMGQRHGHRARKVSVLAATGGTNIAKHFIAPLPSYVSMLVWSGGAWVTATPKVWNGVGWQTADVQVWDGAAF